MSHIKLTSLLSENIEVADLKKLEYASRAFAEALIKDNIIESRHVDLTSSDVATHQYIEDIAEVVRNEVIKWKDMVNARGAR
jgi:hypothetical protein